METVFGWRQIISFFLNGIRLCTLLKSFCRSFSNDGRRFEEALFTNVRQVITGRFGGVTAFMRAPAEGTNEDRDGVRHDDIGILEVMTETLDLQWWTSYRSQLEKDFAQDEIVIRASPMTRL